VRKRSDNTTEQVKHHKTPVPQAIFDVVGKHPQKEHIAKNMCKTAVHEHAANEPVGVADGILKKDSGDEAIFENKLLKRKRTQGQLVKKYHRIKGKNQPHKKSRAAFGIVVA